MTGTWKNGTVVLDAPPDWPEGCHVIVEPSRPFENLGIAEEDWPSDAAGIALLLAKMDEIEPLEISPQEEAEFWAWKQKVKEYTLAAMQKDSEGTFE